MNMKSIYNSFLIDAMSMKARSTLLWLLVIAGMSAVNMKLISFLFLSRVIAILFMNDERGLRAICFAPIDRKSAVYGRYVFSFAAFVICLGINRAVDLLAPYFHEAYVPEDGYFYTLAAAAFFALSAIEMPLLYWKGYAKVRAIEYIVFAALMLLIARVVGEENLYHLSANLGADSWRVLIMLFVSAVLWLCSMFASVEIYRRKDF